MTDTAEATASILDAFGIDAGAPPPAEPEPEAAAPETPEPAAKDGPWTAERIEAERKSIEDARKKGIQTHAKLAKRQAHVERKLAELRQERERAEAVRAAHEADAGALLKGDTRTILATLAKLTGKDPIDLYRAMGEALVSDGKGAETNALDEIRKELQELKAQKQAEADRIKARGAIQSAQDRMHALVTSPDAYPELAAYAESIGAIEAGREVWNYFATQRKAGRMIDVESACAQAELALRRSDWRAKASGASKPEGASESAAGAPAPAKSERSGVTPGSSVSPSQATRSAGTSRPLTEEERAREARKLIPGLLKELGF